MSGGKNVSSQEQCQLWQQYGEARGRSHRKFSSLEILFQAETLRKPTCVHSIQSHVTTTSTTPSNRMKGNMLMILHSLYFENKLIKFNVQVQECKCSITSHRQHASLERMMTSTAPLRSAPLRPRCGVPHATTHISIRTISIVDAIQFDSIQCRLA